MARVLIIEDERDNRDLLRLTLEMAGHEILEAHSGRQGVELARAHHPQIILLSLEAATPIEGLETVQSLRSDEAFDSVPILALTAHLLLGDRERAIVAGCDEYVTKPLANLSEFTRLVERYASGGRTPSRSSPEGSP